MWMIFFSASAASSALTASAPTGGSPLVGGVGVDGASGKDPTEGSDGIKTAGVGSTASGGAGATAGAAGVAGGGEPVGESDLSERSLGFFLEMRSSTTGSAFGGAAGAGAFGCSVTARDGAVILPIGERRERGLSPESERGLRLRGSISESVSVGGLGSAGAVAGPEAEGAAAGADRRVRDPAVLS